MRNRKKTAFTIVELVIVIAVIGILAAVLIPTFSGVIKNANISNDTQVAAGLTTELRVALSGQEIKTEAELMAAIAKIDPDGKRLTPKSAKYGYHFWFDMDNQTVVAKTAKEIEDLVAEKNAKSEPDESNDVQPVSDVQPVAETSTLNVNFRSLLGGGFYLIDQGGSSFVDALKTIAEFDGTTHADLVTAVNNVFTDVVKADEDFVEKFKTALASAVIVTENVVLQPENATKIYFDPTMRFVNAHGTISAITSGTIQLPDSIIGVAPGALVFGSADVVLNTACKNASDVEYIFANASTNATIKTETDSYKIAQADGTVTIDETNGVLANKIVFTTTISVDGNGVVKGVVVPDIGLSSKLACDDFEIYVEAGDPGDNTIKYNTANNQVTVYVSYLDYVKANESIVLSLVGDGDTGNIIDGANSAITWSFNDENKYKGSITDDTTVSATAKNIKGVTITKNINIVVVKPTHAELKVNGQNCVKVGNDNNSYTWNYSGRNDSVEVSLGSIIYNNNASPISPEAKIELSVAEGTPLTIDGMNISLVKNDEGNITPGTYTVTATFNGCRTTTFKIIVNDNSDARLAENFRYTPDVLEHGNARAYYVANDTTNKITFANLFKYEGNELLGKATVKFYLTGSTTNGLPTNASTIMELKIGDADYTGSYTFSDADNKDWLNKAITFNTEEIDWDSYKDGLGLTVEITPEGTDTITASGIVVMDILLVNGTNVLTNDPAALKAATAANGDIVMFHDVTLADSANSGNYTLVIDANEVLYGNGYKINATKYKAESIKWCDNCSKPASECSTNGIHKKWGKDRDYKIDVYSPNVSFISLNGGIIENVYINGPTYSSLQFNISDFSYSDKNYVESGYYVSGITASGNAIIKNSYISGFRQPVQTIGASVKLDNTTLYGGTMANLLVTSGNVTLKNVTTVQDAADANVSKIGAGILLYGSEAAKSSVIIDGELYQYNWFCQDNANKLPEVQIYDCWMKLNLGILAPIAFNDLLIDKMGELIHTVGNKKYVNTGIVYLIVNESESVDSNVFEGTCSGGTAKWAIREASLDEIYAHEKYGNLFESAKIILGDTKAAFSVNTYSNKGTPTVAPNSTFATSGNYYVGYGN